jgi:hypothetical protein
MQNQQVMLTGFPLPDSACQEKHQSLQTQSGFLELRKPG